MEPKALRERVGRRIRAARLREGLEPRDLAYTLKISDRTLERWETGEVYPQLRNRKLLAETLDNLTLDDLQPDLEAEERELRDQLDRLEQKLDYLIASLAPAEPEQVAQAFEQASESSPPEPERKRSSKRSRRATRPSSG
jgi:transcriptional regulator with XRE-family HTH domain